ncbi:amino acid transporter AVT3A-like [Rhododendron vialii]|uniref:amino acid transporter AVT3A-like n=1 Tax=Rhododendron vialii TaxID=182163 RepID=UPI00265DDB90|nr:amino acid transporter AVT3A-like [Rhododendron vialii]
MGEITQKPPHLESIFLPVLLKGSFHILPPNHRPSRIHPSPLQIPTPPPLSSTPKPSAIDGAGILDLPYSFKRTEWLFSLFTLSIVTLLTYHYLMLLVHSQKKLKQLGQFSKISSFSDLGFIMCGPVGRFSVDVMIVLSQAGFCISYLVFIANILTYVFNCSTKLTNGVVVESYLYMGAFSVSIGEEIKDIITTNLGLGLMSNLVQLGLQFIYDEMNCGQLLLFKSNYETRDWDGFAVQSEKKDKKEFEKILGLSVLPASMELWVFLQVRGCSCPKHIDEGVSV